MTAENRRINVQNPDYNGLPASPQEKKEREMLHRAATWLFKNKTYNWSVAFELEDKQLLDIEGIGHDSLAAIRKFQGVMHTHEILQKDTEEMYIARPSRVSAPHGIVIDDIFIPFIINPGSSMLFISLLTGLFVGETRNRAEETFKSIYGNVQFLNSNFALGLKIKARVGDEKVLFSFIIPENIKVVVPQFK